MKKNRPRLTPIKIDRSSVYGLHSPARASPSLLASPRLIASSVAASPLIASISSPRFTSSGISSPAVTTPLVAIHQRPLVPRRLRCCLIVPLCIMAVLWSLTVAMNSRQFSFTSVDYQAVVSILGSWNDTLPVNGTYCGAPTLSAPSYRPLTGYNLSKLVVVHRHGDRSPVNVIPDDVRMTWDCKSMVEYSFLQDEPHANGWNMQKALVGRKVVRIENEIWKPKMWGGSCLQAELTTKGREHLIDFGSNIRQIYGQSSFISFSTRLVFTVPLLCCS